MQFFLLIGCIYNITEHSEIVFKLMKTFVPCILQTHPKSSPSGVLSASFFKSLKVTKAQNSSFTCECKRK